MGKGSYLGGSTIISPRRRRKPSREEWVPTKRVPDESSVVVNVGRKKKKNKKKLLELESELNKQKPLVEEFNNYAKGCAIRTKLGKNWQVAPKKVRAYFDNNEFTLHKRIIENEYYLRELKNKNQ
tara:strand:+ start:1131 stop:1505 length:375 start_codon:yes stop_codon:yes gene_type:complete